MKLFRNNIKRLFCFCLVMVFCCSMLSFTAAATEQVPYDGSSVENIEPRGTGQGHVIYPQSKEVTISNGYVDYVSYTGTYGVGGSEGVIVLKFTNVDTNDFRSYTFICDNGYYSKQQLAKSLPAGTYKITCNANTVENFYNISLSFG